MSYNKVFSIISSFICIFYGQYIKAQISGEFQTEAQYYIKDTITSSIEVPQKAMMNAYFNINYTYSNFNAGLRYESYQGPLIGYDTRYQGSGIAYRQITYTGQYFEITAGNFYEQYGNGMILRTYEDRNLGYDNSIDGIKLKLFPYKGIIAKALWGTQRFFWQKSPGIIRGFDAEISLNELSEKLDSLKTKIISGFSFVSKYQKDLDPIYILPENVAAMSGRLRITRGNITLSGEYAYKYNDPSTDNNKIYKPGQALLLNIIYAKKGLGFIIAAKRSDNMSFRSDRTATGNVLNINYLPVLAKEQYYSFATMYPLVTQINGEIGFQTQFIYTFKKASKIGGKYGTSITIAYDRTNSLKKNILPDSTFMGYASKFLSIGKDVYFETTTLEIRKKMSKSLNTIFSFINIIHNQSVLLGHIGEPIIYAKVAVADIVWRISDYKTLKYEFQHLWTHQDKKNWAGLQIEYTIAPKWFFNIGDQYNYANSDQNRRIHYYTSGVGYVHTATRFMFSYGRHREGVVCVGGVCRNMPAYNGFSISIISSF
ncbi:MAG TPA: DUF6029 family protein [Bacteroidales bacterium]|nr:DUF6029 family protein [Bacteroidales bacterium]